MTIARPYPMADSRRSAMTSAGGAEAGRAPADWAVTGEAATAGAYAASPGPAAAAAGATVLVVIAGVPAAEAARDLHALVEFAQSAR